MRQIHEYTIEEKLNENERRGATTQEGEQRDERGSSE